MNKYREGKVKRTPVRGVKQYLKPYVYKQWERYAARKARPRTFCIMGLRVTVGGEVKPKGGAAAKASPNRALSRRP